MSTIAELSKEIHENARNKGFWDKERNTGEMLMLIVGEVSEAMEADRKEDYYSDANFKINDEQLTEEEWAKWFENNVKNSFQDELADAVIIIFDLCESKGIDIEWHIKKKMRYNSTRPHMHGKKY